MGITMTKKSLETEAIDRLFLELSQVTQATTAREIELISRVNAMKVAMKPFAELVNNTSGRIPHERLSAADWHLLAESYNYD